MLRITLAYVPIRDDVSFLLVKQQYLSNGVWKAAFFTHVFTAMFALLAGFVQFSQWVRLRLPRLHRTVGYVYVVDILCVTGPASFIMALYANGGTVSRLAFTFLAVLWLFTTFVALRTALQRNFAAHRAWMLRSYALTLSALTLRAWKWAIVHCALLYGYHPPPMDVYRLVAWLGFVPNLIIIEWYIYSTLQRKRAKNLN